MATRRVWSSRTGIPLDVLAASGVGVHVHVESLAAQFAGRGHGEGETRSNDLLPAYQALAAEVR